MNAPRIAILGAGPAGLATALALARRGRAVTLIERDAAQPIDDPAAAYTEWSRPGVPHSPQPHSLLGRTRRALRLHAPDVLAEMLAAGAWENDLRARLVGEAAEPGDEDLVAIHCRRPVFECVLRRTVLREPLVTLRCGAPAEGIAVAVTTGTPHVVGVRVDGATIEADAVIDASGRRSPVRRWLEDAGIAMPPAQVEDCAIVYYSRYFRLRDGVELPAWTGVLGPAGTTDCTRFSVFFGDNRTFAIVLGVAAWEHALKGLAHDDAHMRVLRRFPNLAPFVADDVSEPITGVLPMGSLRNVFHAPLRDGRPPVLGLHFLGDAYCHTNPLFAWGLCLGLDYGFELGRIIDENPRDTEAQALAFADHTAAEAEACFRAVSDEDRDRSQTWRGEPLPGAWLGRTFAGFVRQCASPAAMLDGRVARAVLRRANLLDRPGDLEREDRIVARVGELQESLPRPPASAFPSKDELLELVRG